MAYATHDMEGPTTLGQLCFDRANKYRAWETWLRRYAK